MPTPMELFEQRLGHARFECLANEICKQQQRIAELETLNQHLSEQLRISNAHLESESQLAHDFQQIVFTRLAKAGW